MFIRVCLWLSRRAGSAFTRFHVFWVVMAKDDTHDQAADVAGTGRAAPITSRFLFVDVAAQRAKQLRRGALPRLERGTITHGHHKLERVAMEEVRTGVIHYTLPTNYEGSPRTSGKG